MLSALLFNHNLPYRIAIANYVDAWRQGEIHITSAMGHIDAIQIINSPSSTSHFFILQFYDACTDGRGKCLLHVADIVDSNCIELIVTGRLTLGNGEDKLRLWTFIIEYVVLAIGSVIVLIAVNTWFTILSLTLDVYCLSLVNDKAFDYETDEFYHDYAIVDVEHTDRHIEGLRFVFVELPKFKPQSIAEKKMAVLWLRFLTEIAEDTIEAPAELMENEATRKALGLVEKSAMTEGQLYAYERFWMSVVDERIIREAAVKKGYNEGWEKGKMEGLYFAARNMKQLGLPITDIAKATGLSEKEIANL